LSSGKGFASETLRMIRSTPEPVLTGRQKIRLTCSALTRASLLALSATGFPGVATAVLDVPYLDPVVPEKESNLVTPRHINAEVRKERPGAWFLLSWVMGHLAFLLGPAGTQTTEEIRSAEDLFRRTTLQKAARSGISLRNQAGWRRLSCPQTRCSLRASVQPQWLPRS